MPTGLNTKNYTLAAAAAGPPVIPTSAKLVLPNRIRSFIFFNTGSTNVTLYLGGSSRNPDGAVIPASTSAKVDYHDLIGLNFYTFEFANFNTTTSATILLIWIEDAAGVRGTPIG